jgi:hypothetical protein
MKRLIIVVLLVLAAWKGYEQYQSRHSAKVFRQGISDFTQQIGSPSVHVNVEKRGLYKCDGRTHCSQMTSCEEATFFLKNCPHVKMDGDNDGIPCEKQWCNP